VVFFEAGTVFSGSRERRGYFTWLRTGVQFWAVVSTIIKPQSFLKQAIY
jgi:hypothetical protein